MLLESILSVIIISIVLSFMLQSMFVNFHTNLRFGQMTKSLLVMENSLADLYLLGNLEKNNDTLGVGVQTNIINEHLKKVQLQFNTTPNDPKNNLNLTTIIYHADENKS